MGLLKRLTTFTLLLLPCCYAGAQTTTTERMVISENGTVKDRPMLDSINRITFAEDGLMVNKVDGKNEKYGYQAVITFIEDDPNSIGATQATQGNIHVYARENLIYIEGMSQGRVGVFALNGAQCVSAPHWKGTPIDISALPKGVYVLKVGDASFKFKK